MVSHKLVRCGSGCSSRINQIKGPTKIAAHMCVCPCCYTRTLTVLNEYLWQRPWQPDNQTQTQRKVTGNKRKVVRFVVTLGVRAQVSLALMIQSNALQESAEHQPDVWVCCSGTPHGLGSCAARSPYVRLKLFTLFESVYIVGCKGADKMEVWWKYSSQTLRRCCVWTGLKAYRAMLQLSRSSHHTHLFWLWRRVRSNMQYVLQQCMLVEHVWAWCQHVRFGEKHIHSSTREKICGRVSQPQNHTCTVCAHPHAHAHSGSWSPLWLSWKLGSPALTTSWLLKASSTLCDNLLILERALRPDGREPGTVTGGGTNPAGAEGRLGEAGRVNRLQMKTRGAFM